MGLELLWKSTKLSMVNGKGRIIVIIAIIVDWVDPRKPKKKIQTDLGVGCWVSLSLRIERFSSTYLFAQTKLGTAPSFLHTIPDGLK
jgi:hypothetical protein